MLVYYIYIYIYIYMQRQKAVSAYFTSKQILPFAFTSEWILPFVFTSKQILPLQSSTRFLTIYHADFWGPDVCCRAEPRKHMTFVKQLYNVDPMSSTLVQHCINIIQILCVCWECI